MPSQLHEVLLDLFHAKPALALELVRLATSLSVPTRARVLPSSETVREIAASELRVDYVARVEVDGRVIHGVLVEVQLSIDGEKRKAWPVYLTWIARALSCPCTLIVVAPDAAVARWCRAPILVGHPGFELRPVVLGIDVVPAIEDHARAAAEPELAVLSALVHARTRKAVAVAKAAVSACVTLDDHRSQSYLDVVLAALSGAARRALEEHMIGHEYQSDFAKKYFAEGEAKGRAEALLGVLHARQIPVADDARERIVTCRDLETLDGWIARAVVVHTIEELFRE
jgi:hypothetical protein